MLGRGLRHGVHLPRCRTLVSRDHHGFEVDRVVRGYQDAPAWQSTSVGVYCRASAPTPTRPAMSSTCPFCNLDTTRVCLENDAAIAVPDAFPVTEGHTFVIPKRHVTSLFDLSEEGQAAVWRLVAAVRSILVTDLRPDGFNIGVNDGQAAGQTVAHAHVHVIPRRSGDATDPRGGIRRIVPEKARY